MKIKVIAAVALVLLTGTALAAALDNLTLDQAARLAVVQNPAMRQAQIRTEKADLTAERLAEIDPWLEEPRERELLPFDQIRMLDMASVQAASGQTLARKGEEVVRNQLVLEARQKYLGVRRAVENLDLAKESLMRAESMLRVAQAAYRRGFVAKSDVLGAEAQLVATQARLLAAENAVELAAMELNVAMGRDTDLPLGMAEPFALPQPGRANLATGLASALENRFEMVQARGNLDLKRQEYEYTAEQLKSTDPVYRLAALELEEAELELRITEQNIRLQVQQTYSGMGALKDQVEALQKGVNYAAEGYRIAALRYEAGVATQMEVISAQVNLQEVATQHLHARYDRYLTYLQWLFATGRRLE